jgi:peptide/nickel transport system substrate-binding protein
MFAALLVPLGLAAGGPAGATESEDSGEKVTFTVGLLNEVDSFNPFGGIEAPSFEMWALNYDYLISYSMDDMSPEPGLATEWETSEDGLTWTFTLEEGVTFSDGEPLTADDVVHTLERIRDGGYEASTWGSYLTSVEEITAPDDTTVELRLSKPNAVLPLLPIPILPEHVWSEIDEEEVKTYANEPSDGEPVVGSGPFRLVEGTAGGSLYRFEANPDYWKGAPHIDEVVFRVFKSEDTAVQALIKGEIDFVENITALQVESLQGRDGITAINGDSPGFDEVAFNVGAVDTETGEPLGDGHAALQDRDFRYALGYALDRDQIIEKAYQGAGIPGDSIIPPAYENYRWEPSEEDAFTFDLERADELLTEAGYERGADGERLMPDGEPVDTLRFFARSESNTSLTVAEFVQEWFGELGLDVEVTAMESNKLTNVILDGEFDMFEWGWYVEPDPDSMLSYLTCDQLASWNDAWFCNEEYDRLYEEQNSAVDEEERVEAVQRMQEILFEEAPYLVTAYNTIGEAVRTDRFACFQPQPDPGGILLIQYGVTNYLNMRPADEAGDCDGVTSAIGASGDTASGGGDDGSGNTALMVGGGVLLAVLVVGGGVLAMRRRSTASDRE